MTQTKGNRVNSLEWYDGFGEIFVVYEPVSLSR